MIQINIGIAGNWAYHAAEFVQRLKKSNPECNICVAWEEDTQENRAWAESIHCRFEPDFDKFVHDEKLDAVMILSATSQHEEMIHKAVEAGKHVFVEKAPMSTIEGARKVQSALKNKKNCFTVSDPVYKPVLMYLKQMMDDGKFGQILTVRCRNVHDKALNHTLPARFFRTEESVGGTMMDLGCHGVHTLMWLLGEPTEVCAMTDCHADLTGFDDGEDTAVAVYKFENGAIGISESCWLTGRYQFTVDLYGTGGCAHIYDNRFLYRLNDGDWTEVSKSELPPEQPKPIACWIDSIEKNVPNEDYTVEDAVLMTEMLVKAYEAAEKTVPIVHTQEKDGDRKPGGFVEV